MLRLVCTPGCSCPEERASFASWASQEQKHKPVFRACVMAERGFPKWPLSTVSQQVIFCGDGLARNSLSKFSPIQHYYEDGPMPSAPL